MKPRRAVVFCHGARDRTIGESGGLEVLSELFDAFVDVSEFCKPWEFNFAYEDRYRGDRAVALPNTEAAARYFEEQAFDYILVVGLEWSREREALVRAISTNCRDWGILFVRGDMIDLFNGRRYDTRWFIGWRQYLRRWRKKMPAGARSATHYFSNETQHFEFPEVIDGRTAIIPVNHLDYMKLQNAKAVPGDAGIVFADQAVTFTFADSNRNKAEERFYDEARSKHYFTLLNDYLRELAGQSGHDVTVCLHPNAPQDYAASFDPGFRIVRGGTLEHVMSARLVVTHCSMSVAYCHLMHVPTILLAFSRQEMPRMFYKNTLRKARNEKLYLQHWPGRLADVPAVPRAGHPRIVAFLRPDKTDRELAQVLRTAISPS